MHHFLIPNNLTAASKIMHVYCNLHNQNQNYVDTHQKPITNYAFDSKALPEEHIDIVTSIRSIIFK